MSERVLLIEDDDAMRASLTQTLELEDITVLQANGLAQARRSIRTNFAGIVLSDMRMPLNDGFDVLKRVRDVDEELPVIFLTGEADVPMAVRALQSGAYDLLEKPCKTEDLLKSVSRALKHRSLILQTRALQRRLEGADIAAINFPGTTAISVRLRAELRRLADLDIAVHLFGDAGVGKRLAAYTIEVLSGVKHETLSINFEDVDCAAQLSAFEMSQASLLIAKNVDAMGQDIARCFASKLAAAPDIRLLTTAKQPVIALAPHIRACLERAGAVDMHIPSLLERAPDLPLIFESLVRQAARDLNTDMPTLSSETLESIQTAPWRGNLPELRSFARRCVVGLPPDKRNVDLPGLTEQIDAFERQVLIETLKRNNGKAAAAAQELRLARKTLYDRMARHGIKPRDLKPGAT